MYKYSFINVTLLIGTFKSYYRHFVNLIPNFDYSLLNFKPLFDHLMLDNPCFRQRYDYFVSYLLKFTETGVVTKSLIYGNYIFSVKNKINIIQFA